MKYLEMNYGESIKCLADAIAGKNNFPASKLAAALRVIMATLNTTQVGKVSEESVLKGNLSRMLLEKMGDINFDISESEVAYKLRELIPDIENYTENEKLWIFGRTLPAKSTGQKPDNGKI